MVPPPPPHRPPSPNQHDLPCPLFVYRHDSFSLCFCPPLGVKHQLTYLLSPPPPFFSAASSLSLSLSLPLPFPLSLSLPLSVALFLSSSVSLSLPVHPPPPPHVSLSVSPSVCVCLFHSPPHPPPPRLPPPLLSLSRSPLTPPPPANAWFPRPGQDDWGATQKYFFVYYQWLRRPQEVLFFLSLFIISDREGHMFYDWSECVMSVLGTTKHSSCNDTWQ